TARLRMRSSLDNTQRFWKSSRVDQPPLAAHTECDSAAHGSVPFLYGSQLTRGRGVDRPWRRPKVPPVTLTASTAGFAPRCASDFVLVEENRHYSFGKSSLG